MKIKMLASCWVDRKQVAKGQTIDVTEETAKFLIQRGRAIDPSDKGKGKVQRQNAQDSGEGK